MFHKTAGSGRQQNTSGCVGAADTKTPTHAAFTSEFTSREVARRNLKLILALSDTIDQTKTVT